MKSILIVTEIFDVGGLETHIRGEIISLANAGCNVHLATGRKFSNLLIPKEVASVTSGLPLEPETTLVDFIHTVDELRRLIREYAIECVHAHPFLSLLPSLIAAELEQVPFALTLHGPASLGSYYGPLYDFILSSVVLPGAGRVVAVSKEVAELATPYLIHNEAFILPNGVDVNAFTPTTTTNAPQDIDPRWLVVSRLDAFKVVGIADFIGKAQLAGLPGILLVGDGPVREEFAERLKHEGLADFVEFLGMRVDAPQLMQTVSGIAGMGRVVLEGLASRKPVCLIGYDGVKGLVDQELLAQASQANFSGRNLETVDSETFCKQLDGLLESDVDNLYGVVNKNFSESSLWLAFSEKLQTVAIQAPTLLGDSYRSLRVIEINETVPLLQSAVLFQQLGVLINSPKYFEPNLLASFQYYRDKFMDMNLSQAVAERDRQIADLNQVVVERENQIAVLSQEIADAEIRVRSQLDITNDYKAVAERLSSQYNQILTSRSWQITKPIRFVMRIIRYRCLFDYDRLAIRRYLQSIYRRIPLPFGLKFRLRSIFFRLTGMSTMPVTSSTDSIRMDNSNSPLLPSDSPDINLQSQATVEIVPFFGVRRPYGKRRAAILTNQLLDWNDGRPRFGGGERYALELALLLRELGIDVTFFQPSYKPGTSGEYYSFEVKTLSPQCESFGEFQYGVCSYFTKITSDYDHVYYHLPEYASGAVREDGLMTCHGIWFDHNNYPGALFRTPEWFRHLHKAFANPAGVISVDTNSIGIIRSLWPDLAKKMRYIPNFYDGRKYFPKPHELNPERITILFPRRSQINRGSRIFAKIVASIPHAVNIVWVGEGDPVDTQIIKDVCAKDSRVSFHVADFDEMVAWYQKVDIAVIPTIACEGTSLSCIEALACGCAVIATNVGGLPDIIHDGFNGLLVDPDAISIANAINTLIEDGDLRKRLQTVGVETVQYFELKIWRKRWVNTFRDYGWISNESYSNWNAKYNFNSTNNQGIKSEQWVILTRNAIHGGVESIIREESKLLNAPVIVCGGHDNRDTCPFEYTRADNRKALKQLIAPYDVILYHWLPDWAVDVVKDSSKYSIEFVHRTDTSENDKNVPTGIVTHSGFLAQYLYQKYGRFCRVIEHPINTDYFMPREILGPCIGAITSYYETKGIDLFLKAWAILKPEFPNVPVRFYGIGDDLHKFKKLATELELDVEFRSLTERPWETLAEYRCFVVPSRIEGFPMAILEALAMNIPVVASALPGTIEFNETATTRGYEPFIRTACCENPNELANVIKQVLLSHDRPESNKYICDYFSPRKHCDDLQNLLRELIHRY